MRVGSVVSSATAEHRVPGELTTEPARAPAKPAAAKRPRGGTAVRTQQPRGAGAQVLAKSPAGNGPVPVAAVGNTTAEVLLDLRRILGGVPGIDRVAVLLVDGRTAQVFGWPDKPLTPRLRLIPGKAEIGSAAIAIQVPGAGLQLHPLVRRPDGRLYFASDLVVGASSGDLNAAFSPDDLATIVRVVAGHTDLVTVFPGLPSGQAAAPPPPDNADVPEIFKPRNPTLAAGLPEYPADLQPLTPLVTATNSTGSFLMHLDKTTGTRNTLDAVTNILQPVTFRWEVVQLHPDAKAQDRLAALIAAYRAEAAATRDVERIDGVRAGFERRVRHAEEDRQVLLGEHPEEQGYVERAVRQLGAEMLYESRLTLAVAGEIALTVIRALLPGAGMPSVDDIIDIPFRQEGLYLVRGLATPQPGDTPQTTRATSVVGTFVEVRDLDALARNAMPSQQRQRDMFTDEADKLELRIGTARARLADPATPPEEVKLLGEQLPQAELRLAYLRAKADAAGDPRADRKVDRDEAVRKLAELEQRAATNAKGDPQEERAIAAQKAEVERLTGQLGRLDAAKGDAWTTVTPMDAVLVDDATGSPTDLLFTVTTRTYVTRSPIVEIADVTAAEGRTASGSGATLPEAWAAALADLRRNLGRGRGYLNYRPPKPYDGYQVDVPNPMRLQIGFTDQLVETVDDTANVATIAALIAVPFTGGASLAILAPLGVVGAATSAYRIFDRSAYGNLSLDAQAVSDLLNIASLGIGRIRPAGQFATRSQIIFSRAGRIGARLLDEGGYVVLTYQTWQAFTTPSGSLDPRVDQERRLVALLQFLQAGAVPVASHLWPAGHPPTDLPTHPAAPDAPVPKPGDAATPAAPVPKPGEATAPAAPGPKPPPEPRLPVPAPELRAELPPGLDVDVLRDSGLHGDTVRVHYTLDRLGLVASVHILAGPSAGPSQVALHAETARLMLRYQGISGLARVLADRVTNLVAPGKAAPPPGSLAWEAMLEVRKLPAIIEYRVRTLALSAAPDVVDRARADLEYLRAQLDRHRSTLDRWDLERGAGFVAAEGSHHDAAIAAGYPSLAGAPGHYYEPAPGGGYTLHQRADSTAPPKRLAKEVIGGKETWVLKDHVTPAALAAALRPDLHDKLLSQVTAHEAVLLEAYLGPAALPRAIEKPTRGYLKDLAAIAVQLNTLAGDQQVAKGLHRLTTGGPAPRGQLTVAELLRGLDPADIGRFLTVVAHDRFPVYQTTWVEQTVAHPELLTFLESAGGVDRFNAMRSDSKLVNGFVAMLPGRTGPEVLALAGQIEAAAGPAAKLTVVGKGPPPPPLPLHPELRLDQAAIDARVADAQTWVKDHAEDPKNLASKLPFRGTADEVRAYAEVLARIDDVRRRPADYQRFDHAERLLMLDRFEVMLRRYSFKVQWVNNWRGALSELLFIPVDRQQAGKVQIKHPVKGHSILDYSLSAGNGAPMKPGLRPDGSPAYTRWVEQKSDLITAPAGRTDVYGYAVERAKQYAKDAAEDYKSLRHNAGHVDDVIFLEFVRPAGNRATETAMLQALFDHDQPVQAVRFATGPWIAREAWLKRNP
ncbi:hypothetical protein Drose_13585 [Dactylosporangium roseum]|uniref:Tox-PL domain-containing protein n=1 Tax=Dactylosporangium roseum TaxID=47989 RepID=A0ABY5ZDY7_9ACTN|nr:hypothetical protein [Dactylosporangium roseum]UWZ39163.1 hypothetical protein Drose_13585 [Dactylosporangium roseum]